MFIPGDIVELRETAEVDVCAVSWPYIRKHPQAVVRAKSDSIIYRDVKPEDKCYILEWPEEFPGGHDCAGQAAPKRGQYVAAKHLDLNFEESFRASQRAIQTMPNLAMSIDQDENGMPKVNDGKA